jgi:hypothetical protein
MRYGSLSFCWIAASILFAGAVTYGAEPEMDFGCGASDVQLARTYAQAVDKLVREQASTPSERSRAQLLLAMTQYCAGEIPLAEMCRAVGQHLATLRGILDSLAVAQPGDISTIPWYLWTKLRFQKSCGNGRQP